ncbi:hypothetical protein FQR65_LT03300 [Abscondita terminalis]|nr:hypothetical protein FQR65_LT03300 [Abscondita terminalis]
MTYCQKQLLLFSFYLIFLETSTKNHGTGNETSRNDDHNQLVNLNAINKKSNFADEDDNESEIDYEGFLSGSLQKPHKKLSHSEVKGPKVWDQWGKWSTCSVTCGIGKITRWRHCISGGCADGEKEAQIKTCTLPAC